MLRFLTKDQQFKVFKKYPSLLKWLTPDREVLFELCKFVVVECSNDEDKFDFFKYVKSLPDDDFYYLLRRCPHNYLKKFLKIKNIPYNQQFMVASKSVDALMYIKNQDPEVCKLAITGYNRKSVGIVHNHTEDFLLSVLKISDKEREETKLDLHYNDVGFFRSFKNPSERVKIEYARNFEGALRHIENPSEEIQWASLHLNPNAIFHIKFPTDDMIKYVLDNNIRLFREIPPHRVPESYHIKIVYQDPANIEFLLNPTEEAQMYAIQYSMKNLFKIARPCLRVVEYVVQLDDPKAASYCYQKAICNEHRVLLKLSQSAIDTNVELDSRWFH